ncbi:hypothetical protein J3R82DRAFT_11596 [Butyriboletus roseoflavus]|nr:hypothetical protein J3R82DRAFT_11596 [Butyriboletus roseoflavus]
MDELQSEVVIFDSICKDIIKTRWRQAINKNWMERWTKIILIDKEPYGFLCVTKLLNFHTLQWGNISGGSESQFCKETIAIAIIEYCTIYKYCLTLLSLNSAATHFRALLESVVSVMLGKQKEWPPKADDIVPEHKLTWLDNINIDNTTAIQTVFGIKTENNHMAVTTQKKNNIDIIKKVVHAIEACSTVWDLSMVDLDKPAKLYPVYPQLKATLKHFIKMCPSFTLMMHH